MTIRKHHSHAGHHLCRWPLALAVLVLALPMFAHDFYLMPDRFSAAPGTSLIVGLFNGDSFPESEASPVLARLRDVRLLSAEGATDVANLRVAGKEILGEVHIPGAGGAILTARTIPHYISLPSKQFNTYLSHEGLDDVTAWREKHQESATPSRERYSKYAKALLSTGGDNAFQTHETGLTFEIVPEASPNTVKGGQPLPIRVLFRGKPAAGQQIEVSWAGAGVARQMSIAGRTDKNGRLDVPLGRPGKWRLHTVLMERCADQKAAEWESYWASLTFEMH
jgi:hypothetical protein